MRYVIFSDIQGNYEAMNKFKLGSLCFHRDVDLCLGDIIEWGDSYNDNRVIDSLRSLTDYRYNLKVIRGNHEDGLEKITTKISADNLEFLSELPDKLKINDVLAFHSSLREEGKRLKTEDDIREEAEFLNEEYGDCNYFLFGHSHKQGIFSYEPFNKKVSKISGKKVELEESKKYFINPGGLGLDYNLPQTLAFLDSDKKYVEFYTLEEWVNRHFKVLALSYFEEHLMKFLTSRFEVPDLNKHIEIMKEYNKNGELNNIISLMKTYRLPKSDKKKCLEDFSLDLANELEKIYTPDIYEHYSCFSPLSVRNSYFRD